MIATILNYINVNYNSILYWTNAMVIQLVLLL